MTVGLPEGPFLSGLRHGEPAAKRAFHIGREVLFLQEEGHEFLGAGLVLGVLEDHADLHGRAILHLAAVRLVREAGGDDELFVVLLGLGAVASDRVALLASSSHLAAIEIVALWVSTVVLLWNATLLSGSFQLVADGGTQPLI